MIMGHLEHKHNAPKHVNCAVITVSDTRTEDRDISGKAIVELLNHAGHDAEYFGVIKDEPEQIKEQLEHALTKEPLQVIIFNGGTGMGSRDITIESIRPYLDKELPGFGELFRMLSFDEIGSAAIMSRAIAGVSSGKPVFCLPGSEKACRLAVQKIIAPELGHLMLEVSK
jgi:molybdenum cofactor biosynthesis protein B